MFGIFARKKGLNSERRAKIVEQLRLAHGDNCWFCLEPLDFHPGPKKLRQKSDWNYRTIEHLQPVALGGTNDLENLRLCHLRCNHRLGSISREQKEGWRNRQFRKQQRTGLHGMILWPWWLWRKKREPDTEIGADLTADDSLIQS